MMQSEVIETQDIVIDTANVGLGGLLTVPENAVGAVVFAHGSGSSRFSQRNNMVANYFNREGLATLLLDLLTTDESEIDEQTREYRFDVELLGHRLVGAVDWLKSHPDLGHLKIGAFGASTGAAAALIAAAARTREVSAVVSRGGRPDLAGDALCCVQAPTLLIVGGMDGVVIDLNRQAAEALPCVHQLTIVPGATHLFSEPGKLGEVAALSSDWFKRHLQVVAGMHA